MIDFTQVAKDEIEKVVSSAGKECAGLRLRAHRLGRYTFRYQLHLVKEEDVGEPDVGVDAGPFTAYLDPQTADWMKGATVDFVTGDGAGGFVIKNPAAEPNWEDPIAAKVQRVIDEKILPSLGQHGGWVELVTVDGDTAYIQLGGGCQGCAGAQATLKQGIEVAITDDVPEIKRVVDETDHDAGNTPYMTG